MPGKKARQQRQRVTDVELRRPRVPIAVTVVLSLAGVWTMLAYSGALTPTSSEKASRKQTVSMENLNFSSPSKEYVYAGGRLIATEEPCVSDTQPPTFPICPSINVAAAFHCPYATSAQVNYANPVATDNCAIMTVACNPPSGTTFNAGASTVTCTATDTSNNTANCSFAVNVFSACLVDEANPGTVVLFNASTGDYYFCCNGVTAASGRGAVTGSGCNVTIDHLKGNRTVHISVSGAGQGSGTAFIQVGASQKCQISDSTMAGDLCVCSMP